MTDIEIKLPKSKKGRPVKGYKAKYNEDLAKFAKKLREISKLVPFKVSARGWCYLLETTFRAINKDQFNEAQKAINLCRKKGFLPLDFVAEDNARKYYYVEALDIDTVNPKDYLIAYLNYIKECQDYKEDITYWKSQPYYLQMMVEKIDVLTLFQPICEKYKIPICNAKGWSDLISRGKLARRFKEAEELGLKCALLYYGDFDPSGILITEKLRKNLDDLKMATKWDPKNLIVDRFGLNYDFIQNNNLTWVDNLITGSGKQINKKLDYVQDYIKKYGERKCEANAILVIPDIVTKQCEDIIKKYLGNDPLKNYENGVKKTQQEVKDIMVGINWENTIDDLIKTVNKWNDDDDEE